MSDSNSQWLIPLVLIFGFAGGIWYFWTMSEAPEPTAIPEQPLPAEIEPTTPHYPVPSTPSPETDVPQLPPLPPLDDSDEYFVQALVDLLGIDIEKLLVDTALIEKLVTTVDGLTRSQVAERVRPLRRISGSFLTDKLDDDNVYRLNPDNYKRYDALVNLLASSNADSLVSTYKRFYPLLQQAYVNLGYPDGYFNDRAVEVIDHLLETPQTKDPIPLVRPHVLYEYADPRLEALSSGQKLLLRMGNDNATRVRQKLAELRVLIAVVD
jgi:hypothetical protein